MVLSAAHPLLLCCGTWGGGSYSLWAMVSWSTSSNGDPPCWWESGQAVPGWPQGPCRGSPKPSPVLGPRAEVATAMGPLSLSILFPAASTLTGCCPLSAFSPPRPPPPPPPPEGGEGSWSVVFMGGFPALVSPAQSRLLISVCVRSVHSACWTAVYPLLCLIQLSAL